MAKAIKVLDARDVQQMFDKVSKGKPYKIKSTKEKRDFNKDTVTLDEFADVLGTLIKDLMEKGIING